MRKRRWLGLSLAAMIVLASCTGQGNRSGNSAQAAAGTKVILEARTTRLAGTRIAGGFYVPMGLYLAPDGYLWVIDSGIGGPIDIRTKDFETGKENQIGRVGNTSRIVKIAPDGTQTTVTTLASARAGRLIYGGNRLAELDGTLYATGSLWPGEDQVDRSRLPVRSVIKLADDGTPTEVANLTRFEETTNPDGYTTEVNPFGIAAGPDGNLVVADAAGNDLLSVNPASGETRLIAVFDGVTSPLANPNRGDKLESDPVPTGVAFDPQGNLYVAFLTGMPFIPGKAKIVKVTSDGAVSDFAVDLTTIVDIRFGPDGYLYAVSMGQLIVDGLPVPGRGLVLRVREGCDSEVVLSHLPSPTSIEFNAAGDAYVSVSGNGPGPGEIWLYKNLAVAQKAVAGSPLAALAPADGQTPLCLQ